MQRLAKLIARYNRLYAQEPSDIDASVRRANVIARLQSECGPKNVLSWCNTWKVSDA